MFIYYDIANKNIDIFKLNNSIIQNKSKNKIIYIPNISSCYKLFNYYNSFEALKEMFFSNFYKIFSLFSDFKDDNFYWIPSISKNKYKYINYVDLEKKNFICNHPLITNKDAIDYISSLSEISNIDIDIYGNLFKNNKHWKDFKTEYKTLDDCGAKERIDIFSRYKFVIIYEDSNINGLISDALLDVIASGSIPIYFGPSYYFFYDFSDIIDGNKFNNIYDLYYYLINIDNKTYISKVNNNNKSILKYMDKTSEKYIYTSIFSSLI